jgi:hypothetical protein
MEVTIMSAQTMNGAPILRRTYVSGKDRKTTIFVRIPETLRLPIDGGCKCDYCTSHPGQVPSWDTLAIAADAPADRGTPDYAVTVHFPEFRL